MTEIKVQLNTMDEVQDFVMANSKREGYFDVATGRYVVDGKSILGVLSIYSNNILTVKINDMTNEEFDLYIEELKQEGITILS